MNASMSGRVCVVTGANRGIGRAVAEELARRGATVVLVCRSKEKGEKAKSEILTATGNAHLNLMVADFSELSAVRKVAQTIRARHKAVHVLVNNVGVFLPTRQLNSEGQEKIFVTNYLSHFLFSNLLVPALEAAAPARVVNVVSLPRFLKIDLGDLFFERRPFSMLGAVAQSKMAQLLFTQELSRRLAGRRITVNAVHPGIVKTDLLVHAGFWLRTLTHLVAAPPAQGAKTPVYLATSPEVANVTGKLFARRREVKVTGQAADPALARKLWEQSARLCGLEAQGAVAGGAPSR